MSAREYQRVETRATAATSSSGEESDSDWPTTSCWKSSGSKLGGLLMLGTACAVLYFSQDTGSPELDLTDGTPSTQFDNTVEAQYERARLKFEDRMAAMDLDTSTNPEFQAPKDPVDGSSMKRLVRRPSRLCPKRKPFPPPPSMPRQYDGISWPEMCFEDKGPSHVFVMGDYGGITCNDKVSLGPHDPNGWVCHWRGATDVYVKTADNTKDHDDRGRYMIHGVDDRAQQLVAKQMNLRFPISKPHYALNGGDNFYFGGLDNKCGYNMKEIHPRTRVQFDHVFEQMYKDVDVPFFSVFGNHDFGGRHFDAAWDQQIAYTWAHNTTGRWIMPAFYWHQRVNYPGNGFVVDYYMIDTNKGDAKYHGADAGHNICGTFNGHGASCAANGGPANVFDCTEWFDKLWKKQSAWLDKSLAESTAPYKIIVSHFPPDQFMAHFWKDIHYRRGIALYVGSHRHTEEIHINDRRFAGLNWIVVGGGGGISSEWNPDMSWRGRSQYGFMDMNITKDRIKLISINEAGDLHQVEWIKPIKYAPIMVDEARSLAKTAGWKKSNSQRANETAARLREESDKAAKESAEANTNLEEKTAAEKTAEEKVDSAKTKSDDLYQKRKDAEQLAGEKAGAERDAGRAYGSAKHDAERADGEKEGAERNLQRWQEAEEPSVNATRDAKKELAEKEQAAKEAHAKEDEAKAALDKATKEKEAADTDASAKREASEAAWRDYNGAKDELRKAQGDKNWAARDAERKAGSAKYHNEKAVGAEDYAKKMAGEYWEAQVKADAKAYILKESDE